MTGAEVRNILQQHHINLAWIASELRISPQGLNSRLNANVFKESYLQEITNILQKDIFGVNTKLNMQPILDVDICEDLTKELKADNFTTKEYVYIPSFSNCIGITYYGKDAAPRYDTGDIVFFLPSSTEIQQGQIYLITTNGGRFIRSVFKIDKNGCAILRAICQTTTEDNFSLFADMKIHISQILCAYKIVGSISRSQT